MKLIVKIAGLNKDDPRYRLMLDKKAELQEFCDEYESILKEPLPQYAIDGVLPQSRSSRPEDNGVADGLTSNPSCFYQPGMAVVVPLRKIGRPIDA